eukprot:1107176-Rhodomonas_salina.9
MVNLVFLDASDNKLKKLPEKIGNLPKLQKLHLYKNDLTTLPDSIGGLVNLKEINVFNNKIIRLPLSLATIDGLEVRPQMDWACGCPDLMQGASADILRLIR